MEKILYRKNLGYQLMRDFAIKTNIKRIKKVKHEFIDLNSEGLILIKSGYAWDGPSGPTLDTHTFMRGSLVHDAFYELIRLGFVDKKDRKKADKLLREMCITDGMTKFRAWYVYNSLRFAGGLSVRSSSNDDILVSPLD